jgi:hypothetical protein
MSMPLTSGAVEWGKPAQQWPKETQRDQGGVNILVFVGQLFRDLFRFIPGFYSGFARTFSKEFTWTQHPRNIIKG